MKKYLFVLFNALSFLSSYAQSTGISSPYYMDNGIAIKGYDPVAYFKDKKPVKGDEPLRYAWTIVDDKLYLNYNLKVKEIWSKDIPGRIQKAEQYWKTLEKESH